MSHACPCLDYLFPDSPHYIKQPMKIQYLFKCLARAGNTRRIVI